MKLIDESPDEAVQREITRIRNAMDMVNDWILGGYFKVLKPSIIFTVLMMAYWCACMVILGELNVFIAVFGFVITPIVLIGIGVWKVNETIRMLEQTDISWMYEYEKSRGEQSP